MKTPVFVDGSHVLLTPLPGGSASNAARSLFRHASLFTLVYLQARLQAAQVVVYYSRF